jgi:DNA-binding transcriptional regulator GbsR (MarR family)
MSMPSAAPSLTPLHRRFVVAWGEFAGRWGVGRVAAQAWALLYLAEEPMTAEEITKALRVARSNVSGAMRELDAAGIIAVAHRLGDRRAYYSAERNVAEVIRRLAAARRRREIDPAVEALRDMARTAKEPPRGAAQAADAGDRLAGLLEGMEALAAVYAAVELLPDRAVPRLARTPARAAKALAG